VTDTSKEDCVCLHFQNQAVQKIVLLGLFCPENGGTMVFQDIYNNSPLQMV